MESAWQSTRMGSLLPLRLAHIVEALKTLPMTKPEPEAQAHHVASAVILALCLPSKSRYRAYACRKLCFSSDYILFKPIHVISVNTTRNKILLGIVVQPRLLMRREILVFNGSHAQAKAKP